MTIDPKTTAPLNVYKTMIGAIVPRPIAFVSTVGADGIYNLAPFSFFNLLGANPPILGFCPGDRDDGTPKDTARNIVDTGEFVVNVATVGTMAVATAAMRPP